MLSAVGILWAGAWLLATASGDAPSLSSLTAVAAAAVFTILASRAVRRVVTVASGGESGRTAALVGRTDAGPPVPRLSDPDAAGHPRPRAPSADGAA